MKIKCKNNTGEGLTTFIIKNLSDTINTKYPLKIGEFYTVYAQGILNNVLHYLIIGTYEDLPSWYPAELFEIVDNQVYFDWYYKFDDQFVASALWGYYELITDKKHYENLIYRESEAIKIFLKRKKEIDEFF